MKILADENIPFVREAFGALGKIVTCAGRAMDPVKAHEAEILLVRSVTRVNAALLEGSPIRFVGTATIGSDHVDLDYLKSHDIAFANAPGSNAESVAQYIAAALLTLARREGVELCGKTLGVVGAGNTGSRAARNAEALGMRVLLNDPPLARLTGDPKYRPIEDLFESDFITLHVPLTKEGPDATRHLVDGKFLERMKSGAVLINASRGAVVDNPALLQALLRKTIRGAVLDVWEGEPAIGAELLQAVDLGTPHIAGYSFDGKVRGTEMIYAEVCKLLEIEPQWRAADSLPAPERPVLRLATAGRGEAEVFGEAVGAIYDIERDDADLRAMLALPQAQRAACFDRLRKQYPLRREFDLTEIELDPFDARIASTLETLRFRVRR